MLAPFADGSGSGSELHVCSLVRTGHAADATQLQALPDRSQGLLSRDKGASLGEDRSMSIPGFSLDQTKVMTIKVQQ